MGEKQNRSFQLCFNGFLKVVLASVGRGPSDAPSFRGDFAEDLGVTDAGGVAIDSWREVGEERGRRERCLANPPKSRQVPGFGTRKGQHDRL